MLYISFIVTMKNMEMKIDATVFSTENFFRCKEAQSNYPNSNIAVKHDAQLRQDGKTFTESHNSYKNHGTSKNMLKTRII